MKRLKNILNPLAIYYILALYVLATFGWWTVLHFKNVERIKQLGIEKDLIMYEKEGLKREFVQEAPHFESILEETQSKRFMIVGEGIVFLLILLLGSYQVISGFKKEIALNRQQRNFLLSITHELKSPIAGIQLALDTISRRPGLPEDRRNRLLHNSMKDTERLKSLVENILMAAKIENRSITFAYQEVSLSKLVYEIANKIKEVAGQNCVINVYVQPDIYVEGDRTALTSMIVNLVENAIKYTPKNAEIDVSLSCQDNKIQFIVADNGIGISQADKSRIFTKFYRVGNENTRKTKGTGLGLFLVKQLTDFHKGTIDVTDNIPKGTVFRITLPGEVINDASLYEEDTDVATGAIKMA